MLRTTIARSTIPFFNLLASSKWMNLVRKLSNIWLHYFVLYVRTCTPMIITRVLPSSDTTVIEMKRDSFAAIDMFQYLCCSSAQV